MEQSDFRHALPPPLMIQTESVLDSYRGKALLVVVAVVVLVAVVRIIVRATRG